MFFAVPAEEGGDLEWRVSQRAAGALEFFGGKPELMRLGHFDDVDLAMMIHTTPRAEDGRASVPLSNNGRVGKLARYVGRAAHAGGAPHMGVNALYAAQIGLMAINALRETFRDEDTIRVHPILTHGGSQVNVIPAEARIETYVRGRTLDAVVDANAKVDRALRAGALALGATVEIDTLPGYLPLDCDRTMAGYFKDNAVALVGADGYREAGHRTGSTDMGDLSQVMPVLHPYMGGARGTGHAGRLRDRRPTLAYVAPAKALAMMASTCSPTGPRRARGARKARRRLSRAVSSPAAGMARREVADDGHRVHVAKNGRAALDHIASGDYDLIFCDLQMPVLDGIGLYAEIERHRPDLLRHFIIVSEFLGDDRAEDFLARTKVPAIAKPFDPADIRRAVMEY